MRILSIPEKKQVAVKVELCVSFRERSIFEGVYLKKSVSLGTIHRNNVPRMAEAEKARREKN